MDKYSPNVIQNDCLVKIQENETKFTIEFIFNQKYGSDVVDLIFEPIMVYNLSNSSSSLNSVNSSNLSPILQSDDMVELVYNNEILETVSFSTLLARLKLTSNQITITNTKYMIPLNFGILMSGFIVDTENQGTLKILINITKSSSRQINLSDYNRFQLKYKSYMTSKYKIKNSSNTVKLLNHYFSNPSNKKLLEEPKACSGLLSKIPLSLNDNTIKSFESVLDSNKNKIIIEPNIELQTNQSAQSAQSAQSIPIYRTINSTIPTHKIENCYNSSEPGSQNYSTIVNSLYNQMAKEGYDYNDIQAFNSTECGKSGYEFMGQSLIDYEFNDEIEEYKKIDTLSNSQYFKKEKLFNKKISLFCDITKELECLNVSNKNLSFQSTPLEN